MVKPTRARQLAALDALAALGQTEDARAQRAAEITRVAAVVVDLEARYAARGLRFTKPFEGLIPVQAWGHLDGLRFYFRFRSNHASLRLGPCDAALDQLYAQRQQEQQQLKRLRLDERLGRGEIDVDDLGYHMITATHRQAADDPAYSPILTLFEAECEGNPTDSPYKGELDAGGDEQLFAHLVEHLTPVPEVWQMPESTRVFLEQGPAALETYWKRKGI